MRKSFFILLTTAVLSGCGKHSSDNPNPGGGNNPPAPAEVTLSTPAQSSACTSGTILSSTQSSVNFTWNASANTDSYELDIKNLLDNSVAKQTTSQTQLTATLLRGTPYSWYVVSKSSKTTTTAQSDTWKFYNSGPGIITYAPFPAEITSPTFAQQVTAGSLNLTWSGSSVDNDIVGFDVYFGTTITPPKNASTDAATMTFQVTVTSGNTYYWKVITKDSQGNTSDSGLYQFSVN